jgi:hypothetical protein
MLCMNGVMTTTVLLTSPKFRSKYHIRLSRFVWLSEYSVVIRSILIEIACDRFL